MTNKIRIVVSFSGGKDSQATLIYAVNKYGNDRVEAVFCDTGWEHPLTYEHVHKVCEQLSVKLNILRNEEVGNFQNLVMRLKGFPYSRRRNCTVELKIKPMTDWVLSQDNNFIIYQGIRASESQARAKMATECSFFAEYFADTKKTLYRTKDVKEWCKTHDASLFRPIFTWNAQQVIDYILDNGQRPNPLYERGASRVGCFPCIMSSFNDIKVLVADEDMKMRLLNPEREVNELPDKRKPTGFFPETKIPARFCRTWGNGFPTAQEVLDYVTRDDAQLDMFEPEGGYSCMSLYHGLCE